MAAAQRAGQAYAANERLAVMAVAGSVGTGQADRYSDLELDCYWLEAPADADRTAPVRALGGQLGALWDYDCDEEEWSEDYRLGDLDVTVSNFLVTAAERFIDDVVLQADTDPVKHMRLAAIQRSCPLVGAGLVESWRARAACYPDDLAVSMVGRALAPDVLAGWAAREALVSRGDRLAVHGLIVRIEHAVVTAMLAVNRTYMPHRLVKWQRFLIAGLEVVPAGLADRLDGLWPGDSPAALAEAEALLVETTDLAEAHTGADLSEFRQAIAERRHAVAPPPHA